VKRSFAVFLALLISATACGGGVERPGPAGNVQPPVPNRGRVQQTGRATPTTNFDAGDFSNMGLREDEGIFPLVESGATPAEVEGLLNEARNEDLAAAGIADSKISAFSDGDAGMLLAYVGLFRNSSGASDGLEVLERGTRSLMDEVPGMEPARPLGQESFQLAGAWDGDPAVAYGWRSRNSLALLIYTHSEGQGFDEAEEAAELMERRMR
jgi:hypothetical protein